MTDQLLATLRRARSKKFTELVSLTNLDPRSDFRYADLSNSDFRNQDLSDFDFSYSILSGSEFSGAIFNEDSLAKATFFGAPGYNKLDETERYLYNCARMSARYYDRVAFLSGFAMFDPNVAKVELLDDAIEHERSVYVVSFCHQLIDVLKHESDRLNARMEIARAVLRQSYPLDRRKLRSRLKELSRSLEFMRSYINL